MGFHIQLRVNLVKSRKQISKHQNQAVLYVKSKKKNISAEMYRYSHLSKGNDAQHWMKACLKWIIGTVHIRYICLSPYLIN
jgi:hypothetical protein